MVDISAETFAKNCTYTTTQLKKGKGPVLWVRIKDTERELDVKNICDLVDKEIKAKFETDYPTEQQITKYKRHGSELIENEKFMYAHECVIIPVIMHCRAATPKKIAFRSKLGFNQYDITLTKEQSVLKSVMDAFEGENVQTQYSVLGYRIDLYFHDYKFSIGVDEKTQKDRNIDHEINRQKTIEKELSCEFIRTDLDEEDVNISKAKIRDI